MLEQREADGRLLALHPAPPTREHEREDAAGAPQDRHARLTRTAFNQGVIRPERRDRVADGSGHGEGPQRATPHSKHVCHERPRRSEARHGPGLAREAEGGALDERWTGGLTRRRPQPLELHDAAAVAMALEPEQFARRPLAGQAETATAVIADQIAGSQVREP